MPSLSKSREATTKRTQTYQNNNRRHAGVANHGNQHTAATRGRRPWAKKQKTMNKCSLLPLSHLFLFLDGLAKQISLHMCTES